MKLTELAASNAFILRLTLNFNQPLTLTGRPQQTHSPTLDKPFPPQTLHLLLLTLPTILSLLLLPIPQALAELSSLPPLPSSPRRVALHSLAPGLALETM